MATTALCTLHNNGNYINEGLGRGWDERIQEKSTWKKAKKTVEHPLLFFSVVRRREWGQRSISDRMRGCRWWQIICTINGSTIMAVEDESFNGWGAKEERRSS